MKAITPKKPKKDEREKAVLLGLVELYLETGRPIGSNTLRECGFEDLSSATIRNYFVSLEEDGYLKQQHSSGGRIPTPLAYQLYASSFLHSAKLDEKEKKLLLEKLSKEKREIAEYLQTVGESLSQITNCAVFLSSPRFDQDFVTDIKLVKIDQGRFLCVVITDFGLVHTEMLHAEKNLSHFSLKRLEAYFHWRLTGFDKVTLNVDEEDVARSFYNEIMLRHIVRYSNFSAEDLYKTGFSKLLNYPDFNEASALASGLSLFEHAEHMRKILRNCQESQKIMVCIGSDLSPYSEAASYCSVICVPYRIQHTIVGAIGILGPNRIPYRKIFGILETASEIISETLTRSVYKYKISYRQPKTKEVDFQGKMDSAKHMFLEDKTRHTTQ